MASTPAAAFRGLLPFLDRHGVGASNIRVQAYLRFLDHLERDDLQAYGETVMPYLRELHEVNFALQIYRDNNIALPESVVKAAFAGPALQSGDAHTDRSRNIMVHLRVAIYFKLAGYAVELDQDCDVVATAKGIRYLIECKRLYSEKKATVRFKEARDQLHRRFESYDDGIQSRGIVWLDPSPIILRQFNYYMAYSNVSALQAARFDLLEFRREVLHNLWEDSDPRVLACVCQMVWPYRASMKGGISTGFTSIITPREDLTPEENTRVEAFFDSLFNLESASALR